MDRTGPGFIVARWRGLVSPGRLLFVDMMVVATTINLAMSFASLMALGFKWSGWAAAAIFLSPLPWNVFLVLSLWRSTERLPKGAAGAWRLAALAWLVVATAL